VAVGRWLAGWRWVAGWHAESNRPPGLAWKIVSPLGASTVTIVAWQTGPTSTGSGWQSAKVVPPSVDRDTPRQLQSTLPG